MPFILPSHRKDWEGRHEPYFVYRITLPNDVVMFGENSLTVLLTKTGATEGTIRIEDVSIHVNVD